MRQADANDVARLSPSQREFYDKGMIVWSFSVECWYWAGGPDAGKLVTHDIEMPGGIIRKKVVCV